VNDAPVVINNLTTQTVQYSDPIAAVTITATDVDSYGESLVANTSFTKNGSSQAGLPAGLAIALTSTTTGGPFPGGPSGSRTWTISGNITAAPGIYVITVTVNDGSGGIGSTSFTIVVTKEDARAYYTSALFASTSSATSSSATVTLSATIKDITAVTGDAAYDIYPGDIRNATVTFVDGDTNIPIATNVPVGLVNPADTKTGTATYNWSVNIGTADSQLFTIGIIVNGYYTRNSSEDDTVVTVSKPLNNFITGGGYLLLSSSSGLKAGDAGKKNNFGLNVKYNKSNKNLQGNINTIVRRTEADGVLHVYQIKGNSMTSLSVDPVKGTATYNGKANIRDITNPLSPISVDGNGVFQVTMTDKGEPGTSDSISITLWNKDGGLWFSSNWNGTKTIEQTLGGGNLVVH